MFVQAQTSSPEPAVLDHFGFDYISDGQTVGVPFKITITAMDQYNHTFTSYNGTNTLEATEINFHIVDLSKWYHISLGVAGPFVNGVWNGQVTLPEAFYCWEISTSGIGKSGASNWFIAYGSSPTPSQPSLDHFSFSTIGSQYTNTPFNITITAKDAAGQTFSSYNGINTLTIQYIDANEFRDGIINPTVTSTFVKGVWSDQITLSQAGFYGIITTSGGGKEGTSNIFKVSIGPATSPISSSTPNPGPTPISKSQNSNYILYIGLLCVIVVVLLVAALFLQRSVRKTKPLAVL
jgi:hypothetical protein